jgi:uncharacterized cupredoxin-like copper-binding protein
MKKTSIFLSISLCLLVASCGGSVPVTTINVILTDFQFAPNAFTVPAGEEIMLNAKNNGAVIHNFVIMNLGTDVGDNFDDSDTENIYWQVEVRPAGEVNATFTAPSDPGEYRIVCSVEGHLMAGMVGRLIVVSVDEQ